jgi:hypothetical protein
MANAAANKILSRLKGLEKQMRADELPLFSIPAIWENAGEQRSEACDLVLTNQRLFGYIYTTFPRERLFLDAVELREIKTITLRQKSFEALFRELFVSDGQKRVYIRATRKKIEAAVSALRAAIAEYAPATHTALAEENHAFPQADLADEAARSPAPEDQRPGPDYSQQQVRQPLERSPLGITILLVGGLLLEIIGVLVWAGTGSLQTGGPLFLAGIFAFIMAVITRRLR